MFLYFLRYCINTTFTISLCAKTFCTTTIYIMFSAEVEFGQLVLNLDIAHFVLVIWMSDRWPPRVLPRWSCYTPPSYTNLYRVDVHIHGSRKRRLAFESMVQPSFRYTTFLCTWRFSLRHSHYNFLVHSCTISYETFRTTMWMPLPFPENVNTHLKNSLHQNSQVKWIWTNSLSMVYYTPALPMNVEKLPALLRAK